MGQRIGSDLNASELKQLVLDFIFESTCNRLAAERQEGEEDFQHFVSAAMQREALAALKGSADLHRSDPKIAKAKGVMVAVYQKVWWRLSLSLFDFLGEFLLTRFRRRRVVVVVVFSIRIIPRKW